MLYFFRSKSTDSVLRLSDLQFFLVEKDILSMETKSGQCLFPDGSSVRLFRIPVISPINTFTVSKFIQRCNDKGGGATPFAHFQSKKS